MRITQTQNNNNEKCKKKKKKKHKNKQTNKKTPEISSTKVNIKYKWLTLKVPISQNGQTHSNSLSANSQQIV